MFWSPSRSELKIHLVTGDRQRGYRKVEILYGDAEIESRSLGMLRDAARDRRSEIVIDEFDLVGPKLFVHRFEASPKRVWEIRFRSLEYTMSQAEAGRVHDFIGDPFDELAE